MDTDISLVTMLLYHSIVRLSSILLGWLVGWWYAQHDWHYDLFHNLLARYVSIVS